MRYISKPIRKVDGMSLVKGKPLYTNVWRRRNVLRFWLLRSPHPYARIKTIDVSKALLVKGVECVLTYKDMPNIRFTKAGQTYPEPSPYDRKILDEYVRYVGDDVAFGCCAQRKGGTSGASHD